MNETWHLPFRWTSDPDGERFAKPLDAWNADADIYQPCTVVVSPDGDVVWSEVSQDFTDRPDDEPILSALEALDLPARPDAEPWRPEGVTPRRSKKAFQPKSFITYFRAIKMNTSTVAARMQDEDDRATLETEAAMCTSFLEAFDAWRERHGSG